MQWKLFHHFSFISIHCHQNSYKLPPYLFRPLQKAQPHPPHDLYKKETKVFLHDPKLPSKSSSRNVCTQSVLYFYREETSSNKAVCPSASAHYNHLPCCNRRGAITHGSPHIPREVFRQDIIIRALRYTSSPFCRTFYRKWIKSFAGGQRFPSIDNLRNNTKSDPSAFHPFRMLNGR